MSERPEQTLLQGGHAEDPWTYERMDFNLQYLKRLKWGNANKLESIEAHTGWLKSIHI